MISVKTAPRWLSVSYALTNALFLLPIVMLFYKEKGLDMGDFFLIQGIFSLAVFILEIPTGYIGDLCSRKNTLIIGVSIWIIGYLWLIFGMGFWSVLSGELSFGLAVSLISGTQEAYLYDLIKKRHKEGIFHKKFSKMKTLSNISLTLSTLSGGFIYQFFGPTAPLWLGVVCLVFTIVILLNLPDVPESQRIVAPDKSKWQDILDISKFAVKHRELKWLMIFPAVYGTLTMILMWGLQSVMIAQHLPIFVFSLITGLNAFMRTFWSSVAGHILEKINLSGIIKLLCIIIIIATAGACLSEYVPTWAVYICLFAMILGSSSVVLSHIASSVLINHRIQSDERATILSVGSMINRIFWGIAMIGLKPLFDTIGVSPTFMISGLLLIPIMACAHHLYRMRLSTIKKI